MPTEWIDVADTAVKIGLGALITGSFTYLGVKTSKNSEKQKFMLEHKALMLEQISEDIENYFRSLNSYIAKVAGITKHQKNKGKVGEAFTKHQKEAIAERDEALNEGWAAKKTALSKLRLLKAHEAVEALEGFNKFGTELRNTIVFDKTVPSYDYVIAYRESTTNRMKGVHNALANFYDELQN